MDYSTTNLNSEIPIGLGMALMQNINAMKNFAELSDNGKQHFIKKARCVNSKSDMTKVVEEISNIKIV